MLKINVGAGNVKRDGYLNADVRPDSGADIIGEAWNLKGVAPGTVDEVYSRHMLEHLDPGDARRALAHWFDLLKPGAKLNVIVPDIEFHCRQLLGLASSTFHDQQQHAFAAFWGWRDEARGGNREDAHRWGYTQTTLTAMLLSAGYASVVRQMSGADHEPWHLNIVARKPDRDGALNGI